MERGLRDDGEAWSRLRSCPRNASGGIQVKKIDITKLPELKTSVGIQGSMKQKEVGGGACTGVFIVIIE